MIHRSRRPSDMRSLQRCDAGHYGPQSSAPAVRSAMRIVPVVPGCLALFATMGCDSPMIPGRAIEDTYAFSLETTPPLVLHWPTGSTIRVLIAASSNEQRASLLASALESGAAAWNDVALFAEYRLVQTNDTTNADVILMWSDVIPPVETENCRPAVTQAVTTFCIDGLGTNDPRLRVFPLRSGAASRIRMLVTVLAAEANDPATVRRLVAHELGHVLGIARHSGDARDLMFRTDPVIERPGPRDAATVQVLYHVGADVK